MAYSEREDERVLSRDLVRFSRWLSRLGFMPGTSGNLSARLDRDHLLVTPSGLSKYLLRAADLVIVDMDGHQVAGSRKATSELEMHLAVYRDREDVRAVIHAHPPIATAFACAGRALDELLCQEAVMTLGIVPLAPYATTGTGEVAKSLSPFLAAHDAILMANHGAVSYGATLLDAFQKMETLEHVAHVNLVAHQLGSPKRLHPAQVEELHNARTNYLQNASAGAAPRAPATQGSSNSTIVSAAEDAMPSQACIRVLL